MQSRHQNVFWWTAGLLAAGAGALMLFLFPPEQHAFYPRCLFHTLTGLQCPGCGGLRAVSRLLHGDWQAAFRLNPLLTALAPIFVLLAAARVVRWRTGHDFLSRCYEPVWLWIFLAVTLLFGLSRNLARLFF